MLSTSKFFGLAMAVTCLATLGALSVRAERQGGDGRAAFRRPAGLAAGRLAGADDAVWALGQKLFFDTRLSASGTMSCASCHQPGASWTDHLPKAIGDVHKPLAFRAPTLLNAGQIERYGWSGQFPDIEAVTFFAIGSPTNMNVPLPQLVARLQAVPDYVAGFRGAFPDGAISKQSIGAALARYVASITSDEAPFDRWVAGDPDAISAGAKRGFAIFDGKGRCTKCHSGWTLTDGSFHDVGTGSPTDIGRGKFFKTSVKLQYAFKTPTLRNVAARAPYMHDGSMASLEAVVDHYGKGGVDRPSRDKAIRPLQLSQSEKDDLIAFLETLTSGTKFVVAPAD